MLPRVILHNAVTLDGRTTGFKPDVGLFYRLAWRFGEDATLAGSRTVYDPDQEIPSEREEDHEPVDVDPADRRPLLVVPDSRGTVRNWHVLRKAPHWRSMLALCCRSTPESYRDYLKERNIDCIICGEKRVDLKMALQALYRLYGVVTVRVDSGGALNSALLEAGLVEEVSLLVYPILLNDSGPRWYSGEQGGYPDRPHGSFLFIGAEELDDNVVWLRYKVSR